MNQRSHYLKHYVVWFLLGLMCLALNRFTNWDIALSNLFYSVESNQFPLKENRLLTLLFHEGLRWLTVLVWVCFLIAAILAKSDTAARREILKILSISLLTAVAVSVVKSMSVHSCPWDLSMYGGTTDYLRLFDSTYNTQNTGPGQCFPSGHASTALMWIVLLYSPLPWLRQHRKAVSIALLLTGILAGAVQIMKGAHFLSHVLATAWICWAVPLIYFDCEHRKNLGLTPDRSR